ncbi:MAG: AsmA-like C-terminal region-containing protein [Muribaculaceae bacterium]|nr:AsmA-like C-terminal region-containing protein [Muribaculaceae bacterium]
MSDTVPYKDTSREPQPVPDKRQKSPLAKAGKIILWTLGCLILLVIVAAAGATFYLTPSRLASIVNREASQYLKADVKVADVNWTLWSSFPWLNVEIDSLSVRSRSLDSIGKPLKALLPPGADRLASSGRIKGGINILKAMKGDVNLRGLGIEHPSVNLVSVNDSVANYLIFPQMKKDMSMPEISLDTIRIGQPMTVKYLSLENDADITAIIDRFSVSGTADKNSKWHASASAAVSARAGEFSSGTPLPLAIEGDVLLSNNKEIRITDLRAEVADIKATLSATIAMAGNPAVYPLSISVDAPDVMQVIPFIPANLLPQEMADLKGMMPLNMKAELLAPYKFSDKQQIPAVAASVNSDGGTLSYPITKNQILALSGLGFEADAIIDPSDPMGSHVNLSDLRMETDGTSLHISGRASEALTANPDIRLDLQCAADLDKAFKKILPSSGFDVKGDLTGKSSLSCRLSDLSKKELKNLKLDGDFQIAALSLSDAASRLSAKLADFSLKIGADVPQLSPASVSDGKVTLLTYAGKSEIRIPSSNLNASLSNTTLKGDFGAKGSMSSPVAGGDINLSAGNINISQASNGFSTTGLDVDLNGKLRQIPFSPSNYYPTNPTSRGDSAVAADVKHTPLYLIPSVPPMLQSVLSLLDLKATVSAKEGNISTKAYPAENKFSDLRLTTNLDTLFLSSVRVQTRGLAGFISAKVDGLRSFLSSSSAVPLNVKLDADLDDVDINRLAGNYFRGVELLTGKPAVLIPPAPGPYTAADSLCVALPRNLSVDATLSARSAEYMQYSFSPLSTQILMNRGTATLKGLSVGTPFCSNKIDWTYSTSDLDSISMAINADVNNFNFTRFLKAFPEVAASSSQLNNLSANADLNVAGNFLMDPDMFVDAPSMEGDVNLNIRDFSFVRDKKALKYTHLMMIRGDGPITIDSLDIHAAFHDNLLQLDPFTIDGGGYKLLIGGVNNLRGQMYYHIGLLHNPLHLPFGVNIVGYYRKPELRFGGRWIKDGRERKIAADLGSDVHVNIMRNLSHGWLLFVGNAAKYDFKNN